MKIAFHTLGCKVNQYEQAALSAQLQKSGFQIVGEHENPDVFVVNSCTVTAESNRKTRQAVRHYKKIYPDCIMILTGCMAQAFPEESKLIEGVDLIIGNTEYAEFSAILEEYISNRKKIFDVREHANGELFTELPAPNFSDRTRAYVKIEDGCNRFCSYCIIPYARGRVRSRSLDSIKSEAKKLAGDGFAEIVLVGINLSAFGSDTGDRLCDAVDAVSSVDGIKRVRLGSLEPDQIDNDVLRRLADNPKFCPQFHLSLQSGCDRTLKMMNRHYDAAFYRDLIQRIRNIFPNPSITTDIMVGFAGETEEDFDESLAFVKEIGFAKAHIFEYSRRAGTVAYNMLGQVSKAEKNRRSKLMINATDKSALEFHLSQIGTTADVLFERQSGGIFRGYTPNYTEVSAESEVDISHKIIPVKITKADKSGCFGVLI